MIVWRNFCWTYERSLCVRSQTTCSLVVLLTSKRSSSVRAACSRSACVQATCTLSLDVQAFLLRTNGPLATLAFLSWYKQTARASIARTRTAWATLARERNTRATLARERTARATLARERTARAPHSGLKRWKNGQKSTLTRKMIYIKYP